jgi:hypothetical protein
VSRCTASPSFLKLIDPLKMARCVPAHLIHPTPVGLPHSQPFSTSTIVPPRGLLTQLGKTRLTPAFQVMTDVAAVVAAAAGSSRGIGIRGNLVCIVSSSDTAQITCHVVLGIHPLINLLHRPQFFLVFLHSHGDYPGIWHTSRRSRRLLHHQT